jgi:transposase
MTRTHGWAPRGQRLLAKVPHGQWDTTTFLAALRHDRIEAPCLFDGPINGERFLAYVRQMLVPTLRPGDVVVLDNLGSHKSQAVRQAIRTVGAKRIFLPKYSPDLNPIEQVFAKLKTLLARPQRDPPTTSASRSANSLKATNPKNVPTTSGTQAMAQPKCRAL